MAVALLAEAAESTVGALSAAVEVVAAPSVAVSTAAADRSFALSPLRSTARIMRAEGFVGKPLARKSLATWSFARERRIFRSFVNRSVISGPQ